MERVKLQEERARMEIAKTLQSSSSSSATKPDSRAEIDAAVKYAEVSKNTIYCSIVFCADLLTSQQFFN